jgi:hypothetical protein
MDNPITSRRARWMLFGIVLLMIAIVGVIKGFISGQHNSPLGDTNQKSVSISRPKPATGPPDTLPGNFSGWDQPTLPSRISWPVAPKTLSICQAKVYEWQQWYDANIAIFGDLKTNNYQLKQENADLQSANSELRNDLRTAEPVGVFSGLLGIGAGISIIFLLAKWTRRAQLSTPMLSRDTKKLFLLIGGAVWISVVVVICSQAQSLYLHPLNLLVAVVVYSIPAILFDGIAFWWLRKPEKT